MKKTKIAVLVSGGGTNLQALLDAEKSGALKSGEISLVVSSNANAFALQRASSEGVQTEVVERKKAESREGFEKKLICVLGCAEIEMIVLAGFMQILSADFVRRFPNRIINVHPSLIPAFSGDGYYGLHVHKAALDYGVKVTGATVHFVNEITDGGKIIAQKAVDVLENDTPKTLQKRVMEQAEWVILPQAAEKVAREIMEDK
jgi:phosphoribosylglycinamide formyltransferase-1